MTIRWKLNLSLGVLITVFVTTLAWVMISVNRSAEQARLYSRMRSQSQFVADLRTGLYQFLAPLTPFNLEDMNAQQWLDAALDDIGVQIRLAEDAEEKDAWLGLQAAFTALNPDRHDALDQRTNPSADLTIDSTAASFADLPDHHATSSQRDGVRHAHRVLVHMAERRLRALRNRYTLTESYAVAAVAQGSLSAQSAIYVACVLAVLLSLVYLFLIRDWLVRPIEVLKSSAAAIGTGSLDHRVPLDGKSELADLARCLDAMASSLSKHQAELLETRELSAIGELCANVAHGLRNPLAGIRASAQLAARRPGQSQGTRDMIRELISEADRMDQRIAKLFQLSRPLALHRSGFAVEDLFGVIRNDTESFLAAQGVTLRVDNQAAGVRCTLDREQISWALSELVANAGHHSPGGTEIVLRCTKLEGRSPNALQFEVIDQGAGMPEVTSRKAFDLFFTSRPGGTGMGLAMVRRIVEKHCGTVSIASSPGRGTTVSLCVPTDPTVDALPAAGNGRRVSPTRI